MRARIHRPAEIAALSACCGQIMRARDGRGVRGARVACGNQLQRLGHTPAGATVLVETITSFATWLAERSERARQAVTNGAAT